MKDTMQGHEVACTICDAKFWTVNPLRQTCGRRSCVLEWFRRSLDTPAR